MKQYEMVVVGTVFIGCFPFLRIFASQSISYKSI